MFWVKVLVICGFHYLSEVVCPQKNTDRNNFSVVLVIGLLGMIFFFAVHTKNPRNFRKKPNTFNSDGESIIVT